MKIKTKLKVTFTISAIIFVIICFVYYLSQREIENNYDKIYALFESRLIEKEKEIEYNSLQDILKGYQGQNVNLEDFLVSGDNPVSFIEMIEKMGDSYGVAIEIDSVDLKDLSADAKKSKTEKSKDKNEGIIWSMNIRIKSEGLWTNILKFISAVELTKYKVSISSLDLSSTYDGMDTKLPSSKKISTVSNKWRAVFNLNVLAIKGI